MFDVVPGASRLPRTRLAPTDDAPDLRKVVDYSGVMTI